MEWVSGNLFFRKNLLAHAGDRINGHTHNFDHNSLVVSGSVHVKATKPDGTTIERGFDAKTNKIFLVLAEVKHEIIALEDNTEFWCLYSHRNPQGEVVQEYDGWRPAYV